MHEETRDITKLIEEAGRKAREATGDQPEPRQKPLRPFPRSEAPVTGPDRANDPRGGDHAPGSAS